MERQKDDPGPVELASAGVKFDPELVELATASMKLVDTYLENPNTTVDRSEFIPLVREVYAVALVLAGMPSDSRAKPRELPPMSDAARKALEGSVLHVGGGIPAAGSTLVPEVWKDVPAPVRAKFESLIDRFNIQIGPDGYPIPRVSPDRFVSENRFHVVDPIKGDYFTMIRRHLHVTYDLTYDELLVMFGLTSEQLPPSGPAYSEEKAAQAIRSGLGRRQRTDGAADPADGDRRSA